MELSQKTDSSIVALLLLPVLVVFVADLGHGLESTSRISKVIDYTTTVAASRIRLQVIEPSTRHNHVRGSEKGVRQREDRNFWRKQLTDN